MVWKINKMSHEQQTNGNPQLQGQETLSIRKWVLIVYWVELRKSYGLTDVGGETYRLIKYLLF